MTKSIKINPDQTSPSSVNQLLPIEPHLLEHCEYDIEILDCENAPEIKGARKLIINPSEQEYTLQFKKKKDSDSLLTISLRDINVANAIARPKGILKKKNDMLIQIEFEGKSAKFDVEDKYISTILNQIHVLKDAKNGYSSIAVSKNPKLCSVCTENNYSFEFRSQNLCLNCFEGRYGRILLHAVAAEYYGGHKAYLAGGVLGAYQSGKMCLTENHLIFAKGNKDPSKRWDIVIPLSSVVIEKWNIEEQARRQQFNAGGANIDNVWVGSGSIHSSGKSHHLVVPYIDENGIPQEPRFGVSSFGGKAIREWASKLYEQVVKVKSNNSFPSAQHNIEAQPSTKEPVQTNDDPIKVLKMRFAKGEISKEQYEEMRKILES